MFSILRSIALIFTHAIRPRETVQYPEKRPYTPPRFRGRIVLTRDPDGAERCVACYLCSAVCPTDCIAVQGAVAEDGRHYAASFRINFARCIYCGFCEEACPTLAIQLSPDFEMGEYNRHDLVYEKEDLLISGPGKHPDYNFYGVSGLSIRGKDKGRAENESAPVDVRGLVP
ncbi:NADH-quinone oxidoreductase subunit I [delta proteobacterium NaphS2]|nr:NADH-quinone oxidoreductase subunit I [delta proteobacterium NaphS2]